MRTVRLVLFPLSPPSVAETLRSLTTVSMHAVCSLFFILCTLFCKAIIAFSKNDILLNLAYNIPFILTISLVSENGGASDVAGIDDFDEGNLGTMTLNNTNNESAANTNNTTIRRADTLNGNDQFVPSSSPIPGSFVAGAMAGGAGNASCLLFVIVSVREFIVFTACLRFCVMCYIYFYCRISSLIFLFSYTLTAAPSASSSQPKTARCKRCGLLISRSMEVRTVTWVFVGCLYLLALSCFCMFIVFCSKCHGCVLVSLR